MKKKLNKGLTTTLAVLILSTSAPAYGAKSSFKDVPSNHWGYSAIEEMVKKGYLNGMGNNTFAPNGNLTFAQSMSALSKFRKPTEGDKIRAINMYGTLLDQLKIKEDWMRDSLSLALYQNLINENELKNIVNQGFLNKPIQREVLAVYLTKAMGLEKKAQDKTVVHVPYKDNTKITPSFVRYIEVLLDSKVLNPKGTGTGNFEPKSNLTRAELAQMLYNSDLYLLKNPIDNNNQGIVKPEETKPNKPTTPTIETKNVNVKRITNDLNRKILVIEGRSGDEEGYFVSSDTKVRLSGSKSSIDQLEIGQRVEIKYDSNKNLLEVIGEVKENNYEGSIYYLNQNTKKLTVEYYDNKVKSKKDLIFDGDTYVYINNKKASIKDLREGDLVEIKTKGNYIYEIDSNSKELKLEDATIREVIKSRDGRRDEVELIIETKNGANYSVVTDSKTSIYRKRRSAKAEDLKAKDIVFIEAEYDSRLEKYLASEVDADVEKSSVKGYIVEISNRINHNTSIKVKNIKTNKEESYSLARDAYIRVDRNVVSSLPTNPGYYVEMDIEGDEVVEVYADSSSLESASLGKIVHVNYSDKIIEIEIENINYEEGKKDRYLTIYLEDDTIISNRSLEKLGIRDLRYGDTISAVGKYKGINFVADSILLR